MLTELLLIDIKLWWKANKWKIMFCMTYLTKRVKVHPEIPSPTCTSIGFYQPTPITIRHSTYPPGQVYTLSISHAYKRYASVTCDSNSFSPPFSHNVTLLSFSVLFQQQLTSSCLPHITLLQSSQYLTAAVVSPLAWQVSHDRCMILSDGSSPGSDSRLMPASSFPLYYRVKNPSLL